MTVAQRSGEWPLVPLKDVTLDVPSWNPASAPDAEFTYVDISAIDNQAFEIVSPKKLRREDAPSRAKRPIQDGDVLFSNVRTYLRNVAHVHGIEQPAVASTGFTLLRPAPGKLLSRYLFHLVRSDYFIEQVSPQQTGTQYPATSDRVVRQQAIPLPPVAVQRAICQRIDEVETSRRSAFAHIATARRALDRFRQAVLSAAYSGALTTEWREGEQGGRRDAVPSAMTIANCLSDGLFVDGDWVESKDQDPTGEVRLIQLADVGDGVFRDKSRRFLTSDKARELDCTFLEPGDILVARMPEPLGRACVFPGVGAKAVTAVDVCILRVGSNGPNPRWLLHALNAPQVRSAMWSHIRGTTRQRISRTNLGSLTLQVPSRDEQDLIVDRVDRLLQIGTELNSRVLAALGSVARTEQVLLESVFRNEPAVNGDSENGG